jgi:hypothetical protein
MNIEFDYPFNEELEDLENSGSWRDDFTDLP